MTNINIEGTLKTPEIKFDSSIGLLEISGRSNPENSLLFYKPLFDFLAEYSTEPSQKTTLNIKLEHFNTSSSKCLLDIFNCLKRIRNTNKEIEINWYYEDDDLDIMEAGETYEAMTGLKFNLIEF
jgi:hypothetical protein